MFRYHNRDKNSSFHYSKLAATWEESGDKTETKEASLSAPEDKNFILGSREQKQHTDACLHVRSTNSPTPSFPVFEAPTNIYYHCILTDAAAQHGNRLVLVK
jgi:hypothetical protein